ncbi:MAG: PTS sugar transporter subunit IIA, partial [bacterium]
WAVKKKLPCGKIGSIWRFKREDIEKWLHDNLNNKAVVPEMTTINEALHPDRIFLVKKAARNDIFRLLTDSIAGHLKNINKDELFSELLIREQLMSTGIGLGIGVPHIRLENVEKLLMAIGICSRGITDYPSLDSKPVNIVIMIVANINQHREYLKILSSIIRRLQDDNLKKILLNTMNKETIYDLLIKYQSE